MTDTKAEKATTPKAGAPTGVAEAGSKAATKVKPAARLQHVVVHETEDERPGFDDVIVHGQELDALRSIIGKSDWRYVAVRHGQSVAEALKAAGS